MFTDGFFLFGACMNKVIFLTFLIIWFIFDHIFVPKNDKHVCPVVAFRRGMSSPIYDFFLCLQGEGLNIS